jgi:hypothetical protein
LCANQPQNAICLFNVFEGSLVIISFFLFLVSTRLAFQFARQFSKNEPVTFDWLCNQVSWPFGLPKTILDLVHLEAVFDVLDLYLWLR